MLGTTEKLYNVLLHLCYPRGRILFKFISFLSKHLCHLNSLRTWKQCLLQHNCPSYHLGLVTFISLTQSNRHGASPWGLNHVSRKSRHLGWALLCQTREPGPRWQRHVHVLQYIDASCVCNVRTSLKEVGSGWRSFLPRFS